MTLLLGELLHTRILSAPSSVSVLHPQADPPRLLPCDIPTFSVTFSALFIPSVISILPLCSKCLKPSPLLVFLALLPFPFCTKGVTKTGGSVAVVW